MRYVLRIGVIAGALLGMCLGVAPSPARDARQPGLSALSQKLASDLAKAKLRSVIVADFQDAQGQACTLGWYVADELSETWLKKKTKFRVIDRSELKDVKVDTRDMGADMVRRLGSLWGVDAVITGTVETAGENYVASAKIQRVADNATIAAETITLPHSRILDLMRPLPDANSGVLRITRAPVAGVDVPRCSYCPNPRYTDRARKAKFQGTIVFSVLVSEMGSVETIGIDKALGFGLTENAIETVSDWKFKPAVKDGRPIPAIVLLEVTLRLY